MAKGLWRKEVPLSWRIGIEQNFAVSIGKAGKYMYRYLPKDVWQYFLDTYTDAEVEHMWKATFTMCSLFDKVAKEVAEELGLTYNEEEAKASLSFFWNMYIPCRKMQVKYFRGCLSRFYYLKARKGEFKLKSLFLAFYLGRFYNELNMFNKGAMNYGNIGKIITCDHCITTGSASSG